MLNKVQIIGRLGRDPEARNLPNGGQVVNFNVATDRKWTKDGERQVETEWHRVTAFGKLAEICSDYLKKGSMVYIEGRIKTDKYQKDGIDVYTTGIIAESMQMLDSKPEGQQQSTIEPRKEQGKPGTMESERNYDDYDDDLPF